MLKFKAGDAITKFGFDTQFRPLNNDLFSFQFRLGLFEDFISIKFDPIICSFEMEIDDTLF